MILDISVLVGSLTGAKTEYLSLRGRLEQGERLFVPTLVLFEWWRGPRTQAELDIQEFLLPSEAAVVFGPPEAAIAARLYKQVSRPRSREIDLAIAACAIVRDLPLWTLNRGDFKDIPGLLLASLD